MLTTPAVTQVIGLTSLMGATKLTAGRNKSGPPPPVAVLKLHTKKPRKNMNGSAS